MTERDPFHPGIIGDRSMQIQQGIPVREEERLALVESPDEHVFSRQRYLRISGGYVRCHRLHDAILWNRKLRIQVRQTKTAATAASGRHFDHTERGACFRNDKRERIVRMRYPQLSR